MQTLIASDISTSDERSLNLMWEQLVAEEIGLYELHASSPAAMGLWVHGYDTGVNSVRESLLQARRDADRAWLFALNGRERAAEMERRMDRAIAACPPDVEPHSVEYMTRILSSAAGVVA